MSGTVEGGRQAAATIKLKYGKDFYKIQGAKGGSLGRTGGFYADRELAARAGKLGGTISRKGKPLDSLEVRRARADSRADFQEGFNQPSRFNKLRIKVKELM